MGQWQIEEPICVLPPGPQQLQAGPAGVSQRGNQPPSQGSSHPSSHRNSLPPSQSCSKPETPHLPPIGPSDQWQHAPEMPFRTFQPRTREERRAEKDKFSKEKARIAQRNPNAEPPPDDVITPIPQTSLFMDNHERFACRDAAAAEHERKFSVLQKKQAMYDRKRYEHYLRESRAWERNQAACDKADTIATAKREAGEGGARRNRGGADFNILTLDYASTPGGEALKRKDAATQYKATLRSNNLYSKNHSTGFNILTGQPAWKPAEVQPP
ncbi:hypothetical protein DUNSADRAFT_16111 [Dunaliella salina]|uniref:Uncharacterized protein n=1 Tax=Dunaliella salina TaxID=3046 RepID=A0ABQ7G4A5_DUNSA|nr:hypothetical protein DUNSADRAFT_16111 [Dunaliella salina]|eukprot:KAF5829412.1 hypothetical protein DUNSADRAFT_16111 [Dunaliella salina]